jgi:PAS domain S-box-containing protein
MHDQDENRAHVVELANLRQQAEEQAPPQPTDPGSLTPQEVGRLVHELQVHQIELEMQNDELRRTQAELDAARARYFDLYDLAPVGYVTLSKHSLILEANLTAATLLGVTRSALIKQPLTRFVFPEDQKMYHHHHNQLLETGAPQTCEIRMLHTEATPFWALLEATLAQTADGVSVYRVTLNDVSERVRTEAIRQQVEAVQTEELRQANEELQTEITTRKLAEEALRHSQVFLNSIIG